MIATILAGRGLLRLAMGIALVSSVAACVQEPLEELPPPEPVFLEGYGPLDDDVYHLPGIPTEYLEGANHKVLIQYPGDEEPGTVEVDPFAKFLYYVLEDGTALRYPIAVGREGKGLRGTTVIRRKAEWPGWTPTANMLRTEPEVYGPFAGGIPGGLASPLGARALYLYRGGKDTYYRIHGTNDLGSIGNSGSAGCIRLFNQDIIDLFDRIEMGTKVVIRTYEDSVRIEGEELANRGVELPPYVADPEAINEAVAADPGPDLGESAEG